MYVFSFLKRFIQISNNLEGLTLVLPAPLDVPPIPTPVPPDAAGGNPPVPLCGGADPPGGGANPPGGGAEGGVLKNTGPPRYSAIGAVGVVGIDGVVDTEVPLGPNGANENNSPGVAAVAPTGAETTDFPVGGDFASFLNLDAVSFSSSFFLCFNSVILLRDDPTLLGFKTDFKDRARVDIDLSNVTSESLSFSVLA